MILLALVIFLLSNRGDVALGFWPFGFVVSLPLSWVVLVVLVVGFFAGWIGHLPARLGAQRRYRRAERRNAELERKAVPAPPGA